MTVAAISVAAIAAGLLAAAEVIWIASRVPSAVVPVGGLLRLLFATIPAAVLVGALFGAIEAAGLAAARRVSRRCARWRGTPEQWLSILATIMAVIGLCVVAHHLLGGRRARSMLPHPLASGAIYAIIVAAGVAAVQPLQLALQGMRRRARNAGTVRHGSTLASAVVLLLLAAGFYVADRIILVRLYNPFHLALRAATFLALQLALLLAWRSWVLPPADCRPRRQATVLIAALALMMACAGYQRSHEMQASAWSVLRLHGGIAGTLVDLGDWRPTRARPEAVLPAPLANTPRAKPGGATRPLATDAPILLITVDALRADHLEAYGYGRPTGTNLSKLASTSVVFDRAYTSAPHTSFAVTSLLTGNPAMSFSSRGDLESVPTLADLARSRGYHTAAFFPPAIFFVEGERFKLFRDHAFGFEHVFSQDLSETTSAVEQTDKVLEYLADTRPERFLAWVHYFAPHEPYVEHPEVGPAFGKTAMDRYDHEIRWTDQQIGRLVSWVRERHPNAIVVVTADHGEEFGDHGGAYHGTTLYDEQIRVPLLFSVPGVPARRIRAPVSTTSVIETLLAVTGQAADTTFDGIDLSPWFDPSRPLPEERLPPAFSENAGHRMIAWGADKLICETRTDRCTLYDLVGDPRELVDTSAARPQRARAMHDALAAWADRQDERQGRSGAWAKLADRTAPTPARREAGRAIARLPEANQLNKLQAAWHDEPDQTVRAWLSIALSKLGDQAARAAVVHLIDQNHDPDVELGTQAALVRARLGDPLALGELASALPRVADVNVRCEVMQVLAQSRTPLAATTLMGEFDVVRSRICCAQAFSTLRDPATVPFILDRLVGEPYTTVQSTLIRALGAIGDERALPALRSLRVATPEADLARAIDDVLVGLEGVSSGT